MVLQNTRVPSVGGRTPLYVRVGDRGSAHWRRIGDLVGPGPELRPDAARLRAVWDAGRRRLAPCDADAELVVFGVGRVEGGVRVTRYVKVAAWMRPLLRDLFSEGDRPDRRVARPQPAPAPEAEDEEPPVRFVRRVEPPAAGPARSRRRLAWVDPDGGRST